MLARSRISPNNVRLCTDDTTIPYLLQKKKEKGGMNDALLEKERDQLANALERLADVQRELAEGQRSLMTGHHPLPCNCFHTSLYPLSITIMMVTRLIVGQVPTGNGALCWPLQMR